jgi:hypothetical protein
VKGEFMATAQKHKKRSQRRHFKTIPHYMFDLNAYNVAQMRDMRNKLKEAKLVREDEVDA